MPTCTYCGDPADTKDHVIPQSYSNTKSYDRKHTVPACKTCNCKLHNVFHHTVGSRAGYLHEAFTRDWRKTLSIPEWTDEELAELGYAMRAQVIASIKIKADCRARLAHLKFVQLTAPSISEVWEAHDAREETL